MDATQADAEVETDAILWTAKDLKATFGWLLMEMRTAAKVLRPDERDALRKLMSHVGGALAVRDLFPAFRRKGAEHKTLRRFRASQFAYPENTGRWELDEPIAVTPFARMVWDHLGEAKIFRDAPTEPIRETVTAHTPPPKQTPVTWDNLLECVRERQKSRAAAPSPG